jgi:hypothetical protein
MSGENVRLSTKPGSLLFANGSDYGNPTPERGTGPEQLAGQSQWSITGQREPSIQALLRGAFECPNHEIGALEINETPEKQDLDSTRTRAGGARAYRNFYSQVLYNDSLF